MADPKIIPFERRHQPHARPLPVPASLFRDREEPPFVLFDGAGKPATARNEETLYVSPGDLTALRGYLRRFLPAIARAQSLPAADRAWALRRLLVEEIVEVHGRRHGGVDGRALMAIATHVAHFALERRERFEYVAAVGSGAYELSQHAADTALLAVALAVADGVEDAAVLKALVVGGAYADVGKLDLPRELLVQRKLLSEEQWALMRHHPQRSLELLRRALRAPVAERAVIEHHERLDGSGYPSGLRGGQISAEGRYVGLADAFTALAVERPFTSARRPYDAVRELVRRVDHYDPRLLRHLVGLLAAPPDAPAAIEDPEGTAASSAGA